MLELSVKIGLGIAFYVGVLWLAQRNPRAAGIMLTFPTLNGIALLMARPAALEEVAGAMLLMPLFNGAVWAGYLAGFERLVRGGVAPAPAAWGLGLAAAAAWTAFAVAITRFEWGVPAGLQGGFSVLAGVLGLALTAVARARPSLDGTTTPSPHGLAALVRADQARIGLFAASLAAVVAAQRLGGSSALLGALAGLPLVALFGLHAIATDAARPLDARRETLNAMAGGVWLGPCVAMLFVAGLWRALRLLAEHAGSMSYLLGGAALLLAGWALCLAAIWGLARLMPLAQRSAARTP